MLDQDRADTALPPRCHALVPCAGSGVRAGSGVVKQYRELAGMSVVAHTLAALAQVRRLMHTLVVLAPQDREFERFTGAVSARTAHVGGTTRASSVANGLAVLRREHGAREQDWVLVHDAARCLVRAADVERLIAECEHDPVGGLLALPLADTLKREGEDGRVGATLDRHGLWQAQTPQMFRLGLLERALAVAGDEITDEASAVEALGLQPLLVAGSRENFKLTWPADFALAERLLRTRAGA